MTTKEQFVDTVEEKFCTPQNRQLPKDTTLKNIIAISRQFLR